MAAVGNGMVLGGSTCSWGFLQQKSQTAATDVARPAATVPTTAYTKLGNPFFLSSALFSGPTAFSLLRGASR
jgi:hypothetical protein